MSVHFSSKSNEWTTPQYLFDELNEEFNFTLDPCATDENAKCSKYFTIEDDGLSKDWSNDVVFMNPPLKFGNGKNSAPFPSAIIIYECKEAEQ
ncbi:DNA N-6-adenine-methyltransferase [Staphylococcus haemolyticus]|uniref:DNA N-6-adenine-methyltransferase n=1 Tax=Staphylococcus haemolyticus TaxID=1283 RepID=UPI0015D75EB4|nr:DNA N-6-adenine-methyltransferase [Staphylococcus haemolyticus]